MVPQLLSVRQLAISAAGKTARQTQKKLPLQLIPSKAEARGQWAWTHLEKKTYGHKPELPVQVQTFLFLRVVKQIRSSTVWLAETSINTTRPIYIYSLISKYVPSLVRDDLCINSATRLQPQAETICPFQLFCTYETKQKQGKTRQ